MSTDTTQLCCQVYWIYTLRYRTPWTTSSLPDTGKQIILFTSAGFVLSNEQLSPWHWHLPTKFFVYFLNQLSVTLYSQLPRVSVDSLRCIHTSAMEGIFRGSKSFHLATFPFPSLFISSWHFTECTSHLSTNQWRLFVSFHKRREQRTDGKCHMTSPRFISTKNYLKLNTLKHLVKLDNLGNISC